MTKTKVFSVIFFIIAALFLCSFSYATANQHLLSDTQDNSIQMVYIHRTNNILYIKGGQAEVSCSIEGIYGTTDIVTIYANLQQYKNGSWVTIESWSETFNDYMGSINETYNVDKGYTYRVRASFTAYSKGKSESISSTSNTVSY